MRITKIVLLVMQKMKEVCFLLSFQYLEIWTIGESC